MKIGILAIIILVGAFLTTPTPANATICGGDCGACGQDIVCCCGSNYVLCGSCYMCGSSCPSSCSNSATCTGTGLDCTTFTAGGACNSDYGNSYLPSTVQSKRVGIYNVSPLTTCSPRWPTWSNYGGQDDIVWRYSGYFSYSTHLFCDIPLSGSNHPIHWSDSAIYTHTYINTNARNCGGTTMYKCYGALGISSGTYGKSGGSARYSTLSVTGTAVYYSTGGDVIVGTCN